MKSTLNSLLITAGLTLSAVAAYGQTNIVAQVPFAFKTAAGMQPAGEYAIVPVSTSAGVMMLENMDTRHGSMLGIGANSGNPYDKTPRLVFRCGSESGCALSEVKLGDGRAWTYKAPHWKTSETERVAVVHFETKLAE